MSARHAPCRPRSRSLRHALRRAARRVFVRALLPAALALALFPAAASGSTLIGELTDPEHPALEASLDILSAQITQEGGQLTFTMQLRGPLPAALPDPDDVQVYLWFVDADQDPATGQPHGGVGSEFNVRAFVGQNFGGGWVDVTGAMPGGGDGVVTIDGGTISIRVWLHQIGNPAGIAWSGATFGIFGGVQAPGNDDTAVAAATPLPYTPPAAIAVTTPILILCPSGPATSQLQVELRDAAGSVLPNAGHIFTYHSTNEDVAAVDADGLVTAIAPPSEHWQTPYIEVWADGIMAANSAVIRVNAVDVGVTLFDRATPNLTFCLPDLIEGVDLGAITEDFQVVEATDLAYLAQKGGVGASHADAGRQYLVLDVASDPATSVCGASGNPLRLGWTWGQPVHNSCYIVNDPEDRRPQWFVLWHELGHNFTASCNSFNMWLWTPSPSHNTAYSEGLASLAAMWSWRLIVSAPAGLGPQALNDIDAHFVGYVDNFYAALDAYRAAGPDYGAIDPDVVDGILLEMVDRYGLKCWYDLFSTFLPSTDPIPIAMDSIDKQATWLVAAMTASSGEDQRDFFATEYGFPIDETAWPEILAAVQTRIGARAWAPVSVEGSPAVALDRLLPNRPNPFNPRTELRFTLASPGPVAVTIHDARGRLVTTLFVGAQPAGEHLVAWDGRDAGGRPVASGAYFARLVTKTGTDERKLMLVK